MQKLKDLLENVHEWLAKCENRECFLPRDFPLYGIYYLKTFKIPYCMDGDNDVTNLPPYCILKMMDVQTLI